MERTEWCRKIDKMGRLVLPVRLREQYGLEPGLECPIYEHVDNEGRVYLCIQCPPKAVQNFREARELLERLGYTVSKEKSE